MLQKYLACLILLWTFTCEVEVKSQDLGYIILKGTCFDYGTGPDIESEIYSIKNGQKIHLGNSNKNGYFRIKVPTDSRAILFKSRGFHDIELPTQFFGKITKEVEFSVILPTSLLDSARVTIEDMLYIETQKSYKNNYNVLITNNKDCTIDFDKNSLDNSPRSSNIRLTKGPQLIGLQLKSLSNDMIMEQPITAGNGMNFLVIDMPKPTIEDDISPKGNIEPGAYLFRIIYFDQSSYKLPEYSKQILDSLARIVARFPKYTVKLTGYADNLGEKRKNLVLSEYRTRVVAGYLVKQGVSESQLFKTWHGDENIVSVTEPNKNRRVVIEIKQVKRH